MGCSPTPKTSKPTLSQANARARPNPFTLRKRLSRMFECVDEGRARQERAQRALAAVQSSTGAGRPSGIQCNWVRGGVRFTGRVAIKRSWEKDALIIGGSAGVGKLTIASSLLSSEEG
jgi:hypothetical protein